jgi:hypothetical protein
MVRYASTAAKALTAGNNADSIPQKTINRAVRVRIANPPEIRSIWKLWIAARDAAIVSIMGLKAGAMTHLGQVM